LEKHKKMQIEDIDNQKEGERIKKQIMEGEGPQNTPLRRKIGVC